MIRELRINYVFATPEYWNKVELACSELGWTKATILKQMVHGFMAAHGSFYARAGLLDAAARGMDESDYFRILRDSGEDSLARYVDGRPAFGRSPIDDVLDVSSGDSNKHRYNVVGLSSYNYVLLRVALIVDGGSLVQLLSRILVKHLDDRWDSSYQPQIDRDLACKFL